MTFLLFFSLYIQTTSLTLISVLFDGFTNPGGLVRLAKWGAFSYTVPSISMYILLDGMLVVKLYSLGHAITCTVYIHVV